MTSGWAAASTEETVAWYLEQVYSCCTDGQVYICRCNVNRWSLGRFIGRGNAPGPKVEVLDEEAFHHPLHLAEASGEGDRRTRKGLR